MPSASHVPPDRRAHLLGRLPLFAGLWNEELLEIGSMCRVLRADANLALFDEGETSDGLYVLLSGKVEIRTRKAGRLHMVLPGDIFGEIGLITQRRRTASAITRDESALLELRRDEFNRLLGSAPRVAAVTLRNITEHLAAHLIRMNDRVTTEYLPPASS